MSSYHLSELIQTTVVKLGRLAAYRVSPVNTTTTVGNKTVITDTTLAMTVNELAHGVAIITYDAGAAAAVPEGEMSSIASNTATTITLSTALSADIAAGDEVMLIRPTYPLVEWLRGANMVLKSLGDIPLWDITTTLVTDQTEYTLPATILQPIEVWTNTSTTSLAKDWVQLPSWTIQSAAPGTVKTIRIPLSYVDSGKSLGIVYNGAHPTVHDWDDHIDAPIELVAGKLAWHMVNRGGINDRNRTQADKILAEANDAERMFRIPNKKGKATQFLSWGNS